MKLALITTVFRRPELTRIVLDYYHSIKPSLAKFGIHITVYAAFSPDDDPNFGRHDLAHHEKNGLVPVFVKNDPLSSKWNAVSARAYEDDPDAILIFGSDDLINTTYIRLVTALASYGHDAITPSSCYFFSPLQRRASFLRDARVGAGRLFTREILNKCDGQPWQTGVHIRPDQCQDTFIQSLGHRFHYVDLVNHELGEHHAQKSPIVLDVKTEFNRWSFSDFDPERNPGCSHVDAFQLLHRQFPTAIAELIWNFSQSSGTNSPPLCNSPDSKTDLSTSKT